MTKLGRLIILATLASLPLGIAETVQVQAFQNDVQSALSESSSIGYVCRVGPHYGDGPASRGDFGFVWVYFRSESHCGGTNMGSGYLHSTGATHSQSHPDYLYSESGLMAMAEMLHAAAIGGEPVRFWRCSDEKTSCIRYVQFRGTTDDVDVL